jgi:hypothetical protein
MPLYYKYIRKQDDPNVDPKDVLEFWYTLDKLQSKFTIKTPTGYTVFDSPAEYLEFFDNTPIESRQFHEVIFDLPQKLRFDLDAKRHDVLAWVNPNAHDETLHEIAREFGLLDESSDVAARFDQIITGSLNAILDAFLFIYGVELPAENVIICKSSGGEKCSAHIIIDGYHVREHTQAGEFCQQVLRQLPESYHQFIDAGVYKRTQNFRLAGCTKGDGRYKQIVSPGHITPAATFISQPGPESVPLKDIVGVDAPADLTPVKIPSEDIECALNLCSLDDTFRAHRFLRASGSQLYFARIVPSYCAFCSREHTHDNTAGVIIRYTGDTAEAFKFCRKSAAPGVKLGQFRAAAPLDADPERPVASTREQNIISAIEWVNSADRDLRRSHSQFYSLQHKHIYSETTLRPFELTPTLVVHAGMKMGKTKALKEYVDKYFSSTVTVPIVRILSFRQTFSGNIKEKFADFALYSDLKGPIDHPRVIIQVESLHRLAIRPGMEPPDLLIMDECESIFEQFNSGLLRGNFNECFAKFQYLIRHSRHLICMDAGISDRTFRILRQMRPGFIDSAIYHRNEHKNAAADSYYVCGSRVKWLSYLYASIEENMRVSVPISSLAEAKALAADIGRKFPAKTIRIYSSETSPSDKREHFANVHTYWGTCDVLIYTPTVSAGVSFELKHFDRVFGYFTDQSCPAETCLQMLGRVRDVSTREYYICIQATGNNLPDTEDAVKQLLYDRRTHLLNEYEIGGLQLSYTATGHVQYHGDYFQLWVENTIVRNASTNRFARRLLGHIADSGAEISFLSDEVYESDFGEPLYTDGVLNDSAAVLEGDLKTAKSQISTEDCGRIAAAGELNPDEVEQIRADIGAQRDIPRETLYAYEKYRMRNDYKYDGEITPEFVATYRPRNVRRIFRNLSRVIGRDSEVAWRAMMAAERATHEYRFVDEETAINADINRTYTSDHHRRVLSLLRLFGWDRIDDAGVVRHRDRILQELDEKMYWDNIGPACAGGRVKTPSMARAGTLKDDPGVYLNFLLKPLNRLLYSLYGAKLTYKYGDQTLIQLTICRLFASTSMASIARKVPHLVADYQ